MRSGDLQAVNDSLIRELLADPKFKINSDGTILRLFKGEWILAGRRDQEGYIEIYYKGKRLRAHRIIYEKFKGRLACDLIVDHNDRDPGNNHPGNLELCAQRKNVKYIARRIDRRTNANRKTA